jgi:hypothetical protein
MKKIFKYLVTVAFITTLASCSTNEEYEDFKFDVSPVVDMSGDWYVQTFVDGDIEVDYALITTSNTAEDDGSEIQIFDQQNIWWFNAKTPVNVGALTFSGNDLASAVDGYEITVTITNGAILKKGTTSTSGRISDSISFDIEFSDDPGTIYHIEGYKRTGFLEDEH